jgi:ParB family chromosome partitioning protein
MNLKDRPRLGKGLKGLISTKPIVVQATPPAPDLRDGAPHPNLAPVHSALRQIPLDLISANPHQPRSAMDPAALAELAASIKIVGVLQPILVRPDPADAGRYQLVAGHRRTAAARAAGLTSIPAIVRADTTDETQAEWALIENIQRADLNPIERAKAYRAYIERFSFTQQQAAERLGEDRTSIANHLRLLELNPGIQDLIGRGLLSTGHGKVLAGITDRPRQDTLANQCITQGLSVRKLEELVAVTPLAADVAVTQVAAHTRTLVARSPHILELETELSHKLGTKVRIAPARRKNSGKIVINYYSLDDFDRIVERLEPKA